MTKQELLAEAEKTIEAGFELIRGKLKDIVCDAWEEGKKSADTEKAEVFAREIVEQVKKSIIVPYEMKQLDPTITTNTWELEYTVSNVLDACKQCVNNPANGGSGVCHCILGSSPIT